MCGFAGYLSLKNNVHYEHLKLMQQSIAHRGPDDDGLFVEENIALGHRRLAILDLSPAGHQPMFDHYENLCIVFNGEIYNFKEIRKELPNYLFKSQN